MIKNFIKITKDKISNQASIIIFLIWIFWNEFFGPQIVNIFAKNTVDLNLWYQIISITLLVSTLIFIGKNKLSFKIQIKKDIIIIIFAVIALIMIDQLTYFVIEVLKVSSISTNSSNIIQMVELKPITTNIITIFLGPITEELIYRVGMFRFLSNWFKPWHVVVVTMLLFGFSHISTAIFTGKYYELVWLISYSGAGLVFGAIYAKEKRFSLVLIIHIIFNAIASL